MNAIVNMIRNGYTRRADGSFVKVIEFPNGGENNGNHNVDRIVRDRTGKIVSVESQNQRN